MSESASESSLLGQLYDYAKELMGYDDIPRSREEWEARFGAEY